MSDSTGTRAASALRSRGLTQLGAVGPLVVLSGFGALALMSDYRDHGWGYLLAVSWIFLGLVVAFVHDRGSDHATTALGTADQGNKLRAGGAGASRQLGLGLILVVGVTARLLVLVHPPSLSDDVFRYLWDGRVVLAGENPYLVEPDAQVLAPLRDDLWRQTAHRDVPTVYPPVALSLFSIATLLPRPIVSYRLIVLLLDVAACVVLWRLAVALAVPRRRVLLYAWNPLVVIEGVGSGHVDVVGVLFVLLALGSLVAARDDSRIARRRTARAGVWAALGVLTKLAPLVVAPLWWRSSSGRQVFLIAFAVVLLVGLVPIGLWSGGVPPGLVTYGVSWEFNGAFHEPLWRTLDALGIDTAAKSALERLKQLTGIHDSLNPLFAYLYPQLMAKAVLAIVALVIVVRGMWSRDLISGTRTVLGGVLLCSATLYPWYVLWIVPLAALTLSPFWLVLTASVQFAYLPRLFGVELFPMGYLLVWLPPSVVSPGAGMEAPFGEERSLAFGGRGIRGIRDMRYALCISYRGTDWAGWQRQDNAPTVQEAVETALEQVVGSSTTVVGSGRTDAGVHARAQVAHVDLSIGRPQPLPCKALVLGTNTHLPETVRVLSAARMPADFHARYSAVGKRYVYRLSTQRVLSPLDALFRAQLDSRADLEIMTAAADVFVGRHDFAAFANAGGSHASPVREVTRCELIRRGSLVDVIVEGEGFLKGMARSMVGTLIEVGLGRLSQERLAELLEGGPRSQAGPTAAAHGLCLERVFYPADLEASDVFPPGASWS